jgi:hypothetical protein
MDPHPVSVMIQLVVQFLRPHTAACMMATYTYLYRNGMSQEIGLYLRCHLYNFLLRLSGPTIRVRHGRPVKNQLGYHDKGLKNKGLVHVWTRFTPLERMLGQIKRHWDETREKERWCHSGFCSLAWYDLFLSFW